jgi:hypothetical protein
MGTPGHNAAHAIAADLSGTGTPARARPAIQRARGRRPLDRALSSARGRRLLVRLARQPILSGLVERLGRRG